MAASDSRSGTPADAWPDLPFEAWKDTCATLHMWTQIVGKIRLACTPWINHSWHVTLYVTSRGLTTSPIPHGHRTFQIEFDFVDHQLRISSSDARSATVELRPRSVADFYRYVMARLEDLGLHVVIHGSPNEVVDPIPFGEDETHHAYDALFANRFWQVVASSARVFSDFRGRFLGKCSPVHFFWGSFDLAVTRFSGRRAPPHPGGIPNLPDWIAREAYSHEVSSAGFWPGGDTYPHPIFYSYAYPPPNGFSEGRVRPEAAHWDTTLSEFVLPYDAIRRSPTPDDDLMTFLQSTYEAAADLGGWDRAGLEWPPGERPRLGLAEAV
jgi:hypothetical protein